MTHDIVYIYEYELVMHEEVNPNHFIGQSKLLGNTHSSLFFLGSKSNSIQGIYDD